MEFLEALEQSGLARALKTSFFAYPVVNALHILSIGAVLTSVMLMDLYVLGAIQAVAKAPFMALLRRVALIAFCGALITGFTMFAIKATDYAAMPIFLAKITLIALAALNFLFFLKFDQPTEMPSKWIRVSAIASLGLWVGVLLCGRFIGFL